MLAKVIGMACSPQGKGQYILTTRGGGRGCQPLGKGLTVLAKVMTDKYRVLVTREDAECVRSGDRHGVLVTRRGAGWLVSVINR